ncbi:MAG TPA: hypothetical protein VIX11_05290 [Candidatus Acidoferrum sp.]
MQAHFAHSAAQAALHIGSCGQVIDAWADRQEPVASPYEAVKDLIGIVHAGNPKGSVRTGRRFTKLLKRRRSAS